MELNTDQEKVASHVHGRALVVAGPGSGKTATITERVGRLFDAGISPYNILCVTFTNKAAQEMKERIQKRYGDRADRMTVCTFHSFCVRVLREFGSNMGYGNNLTIWDTDDQHNRMSAVARQMFADREDIEVTKPQIKKLCRITNEWREQLGNEDELTDYVDAGDMNDEELLVIKEYLKRMRSSNSVDFSGLLSETCKLLGNEVEVRERLQKRFTYLQVDEYQDTNVAQNQIVEFLAGENDNVVAVGDRDQSIFQWRGASPKGIENYIKNAKQACQTFTMGINYRSTPEIIACADALIRHNPGRIPIEFRANREPNGKNPTLLTMDNPNDEADAIAGRIQAYIGSGVSPKEIAILYRMNSMSRPLEQALMRNGVPYKVIGGLSFYDRAEVKDCMAMLRLLVNHSDEAAFTRLSERLSMGVGPKTVGQIENFAEANKVSILEACGRCKEYLPDRSIPGALKIHDMLVFDQDGKTPSEVMTEVLEKANYFQWLREHNKDDSADDRVGNVQQMVIDIDEFISKQGGGLSEYLQYISLLTSADEKVGETVSLMTMHACKGLEFDCVFIIGVEKTIIPHQMAIKDRGEEGLYEERNLLYVAITRGRVLDIVSWCRTRPEFGSPRGQRGFDKSMRSPSVFLKEAKLMSESDYARFTNGEVSEDV